MADSLQIVKQNQTYQSRGNHNLLRNQPDDDRPNAIETFLQMYSAIPITAIKAVIIVIFAVGILANSLLIIYLLASRRYKAPLFALITSLAVADFGTCWSSLLFLIFLFPTMDIPGTEFLCNITNYIVCCFYYSSVYHLLLFACMRYAQLIHPLWSRARITWQSVFSACGVIWICNCIGNIFFAVTYNAHDVHVMNQTVTMCEYDGKVYTLHTQHYFTSLFGFIIPALLITITHIAKQCMLKRSDKRSVTTQKDNRLNSDPRALTIVLLLYYLTVTPNLIYVYIFSIFQTPPGEYHNLLYITFILLSFANSVLDPFVYCIAARSVRKDIHEFFCGVRSKDG